MSFLSRLFRKTPAPAPRSTLARPDASAEELWEHWRSHVTSSLAAHCRPIDDGLDESRVVVNVSASGIWQAMERFLSVAEEVFGQDPRFPRAGALMVSHRPDWQIKMRESLDPLHELEVEIKSGVKPQPVGARGAVVRAAGVVAVGVKVVAFLGGAGKLADFLGDAVLHLAMADPKAQRRNRYVGLVAESLKSVVEVASEVWDVLTDEGDFPKAASFHTGEQAGEMPPQS